MPRCAVALIRKFSNNVIYDLMDHAVAVCCQYAARKGHSMDGLESGKR